jgi:hypothetical protein
MFGCFLAAYVTLLYIILQRNMCVLRPVALCYIILGLVSMKPEEKRPLDTPRPLWEDNIELDL